MKHFLLFVLLILFSYNSFSQLSNGRVVINEYMPWPAASCGDDGEFIELLNFGPGPVNIGCYVLTVGGQYTITIPANTILQPGQFYLIGGKSFFPSNCANVDSTGVGVSSLLNWYTCGCTNVPFPATGIMADGGSGSTQIVLQDANLKVLDAVVRQALNANVPITTPAIAGCGSKSYFLDTVEIQYEILGMSAGRGNSFARKRDGDCEWVKQPQISGNASNNKGTSTSDVTYNFSVVQSMSCQNTQGSITVNVKYNDYDLIFPMNYTLAFDSNNNGVIDLNDTYTHGFDDTPPDVTIGGLGSGTYRLTIASKQGCYLASFDFVILPCSFTLPVQLKSFTLRETVNRVHNFSWILSEVESLKKVILEQSMNGIHFMNATVVEENAGVTGAKQFNVSVPEMKQYIYYRLKVFNKDGSFFYSPIITSFKNETVSLDKIWPNPAKEFLNLNISSADTTTANYYIYNSSGAVIYQGKMILTPGITKHSFPIDQISAGVYQIRIIKNSNGSQPTSFRFVKQ